MDGYSEILTQTLKNLLDLEKSLESTGARQALHDLLLHTNELLLILTEDLPSVLIIDPGLNVLLFLHPLALLDHLNLELLGGVSQREVLQIHIRPYGGLFDILHEEIPSLEELVTLVPLELFHLSYHLVCLMLVSN